MGELQNLENNEDPRQMAALFRRFGEASGLEIGPRMEELMSRLEAGEDPDFGVTMGLFSYPVLMAADILMFKAQKIPVGRDQIQHVEMARDIAQRFNHNFAEVFTLPEAVVDDNAAVLQGLDGRKMSKSYNNTIPLFQTEKQLRKSINKIKTNLLEPGEPKNPDDSTVFQVWSAFASADETARMRREFANGIAWGEAKKQLFELVNAELVITEKQGKFLTCRVNEQTMTLLQSFVSNPRLDAEGQLLGAPAE